MTEEPPKNRNDQIPVLVSTAARLMDQVEELAQASGHQFVSLAERSRTNRRISYIAISGLVLDIVLSIVLTFGLYQIHALTERLNVAQTTTRQRALCPLYRVFLDSKSPQGRKLAPDPQKYDRAFRVIGKGYNALKCEEFIHGAKR